MIEKHSVRSWEKIIVVVSVLVPLLVVVLFNIAPPTALELPFNPKILPLFHALINGTVFVLLLASWYFIKNKQIAAHRRCNIAALVLSALFLLAYGLAGAIPALFLRMVPVTAYHLLLAAPVYAALLWLKRLQAPKMGG